MDSIIIALGSKAKDKITGVQGTVMGRCEYLTGCTQYCLQPSSKDGKDLPDNHWFDEGRVEEVEFSTTRPKPDVKSAKNGCDIKAPKL